MIPRLIRILYLILFFVTPLVMNVQTSELFEFNKMLTIYVSTVCIGGLWAVWMILQNPRTQFPRLIMIPILLFLGILVVSTLFSIDPHTSVYGYYGRFNGGLLSIISYFVLFFVGIQVWRKENVIQLLYVSMLSSAIVVLWALPGKMGHDLTCLLFTGDFSTSCWTDQFRPTERMFSTLGQPNWLGAYLVIHLCLGLWYTLRNAFAVPQKSSPSYSQKKKKQNQSVRLWSGESVVGMGYVLLMMMGIVFTGSRSALAAAVGAGILFGLGVVFVYARQVGEWTRSSLQSSVLVVRTCILTLIMGGCLLVFGTGISSLDRMVHLPSILSSQYDESEQAYPLLEEEVPRPTALEGGVTDSFEIRTIVWEGALELGRQYPLFGTGVETFAYAYTFVRPVAHNTTSEWDFVYNKAHNEFLNYLATTGYLGLGAYLMMIGMVYFLGGRFVISRFRNQHKTSIVSLSPDAVLIATLLIAYTTIHITNAIGFSTTTINLIFYLIPAWIVVLSMYNTTPETNNKESDDTPWHTTLVRAIGLLVVAAGVLQLLGGIVRYYEADVWYARGKGLTGDQDSIVYLETALEARYDHIYDDALSRSIGELVFLYTYGNEEPPDIVDDLITAANQYNARSLEYSMQNVSYWKTRARNQYLFYQGTDDVSYLVDGIESLKLARTIAPNTPKLLHNLGQFYSLLADEQMNTQDTEEIRVKALESLDLAIQLKPNYRDAYFLKGQLLAQWGRTNEAQDVFTTILDSVQPKDTQAREELEKIATMESSLNSSEE